MVQQTPTLRELTRWLARLGGHRAARSWLVELLEGLRASLATEVVALAVRGAAPGRHRLRGYSRSLDHSSDRSRTIFDPRPQQDEYWRGLWSGLETRARRRDRLQLLRSGAALLHLDLTEGLGRLLIGPRCDGAPFQVATQEILELLALQMAPQIDRVLLRESSRTDESTGLLNRGAIYQGLRDELRRAGARHQPITLGIVELDELDTVRGTLGHPAGEALVRGVCRELAEALRPADSLGRYGGNELLLVLPDTPMREASRLVQELRERVRSVAVDIDAEQPLRTTLSVGLLALEYGIEAASRSRIEDLVAVADFALLQAKQRGGDRVHKWSWRHAQPLRPLS